MPAPALRPYLPLLFRFTYTSPADAASLSRAMIAETMPPRKHFADAFEAFMPWAFSPPRRVEKAVSAISLLGRSMRHDDWRRHFILPSRRAAVTPTANIAHFELCCHLCPSEPTPRRHTSAIAYRPPATPKSSRFIIYLPPPGMRARMMAPHMLISLKASCAIEPPMTAARNAMRDAY